MKNDPPRRSILVSFRLISIKNGGSKGIRADWTDTRATAPGGPPASKLSLRTSKVFAVARASLSSALILLSPPFLRLDRWGPTLLGIEFVIMLALGVLAMVTDDWFSGPPGPTGRPRLPDVQATMPKDE